MSELQPTKPSAELPPIPPVLLTTPRRIKLKKISSGFGLWALRIFLLPHSIVGLCVAAAVIIYPAWYAYGTNNRAQVISARYYRSTSKNHQSTEHYELTYVYPLAGQPRQGKSDVDEAIFFRAGAKTVEPLEKPIYGAVNVRSLGRPPLIYDAVVEPGMTIWQQWCFILVFALFWNGIMSLFWWAAYVTPFRMRRLYRTGHVGFGVITEKYISKGKNRTCYLKYDFYTETGVPGHDKMTVADRKEYEAAQIGQNVIVLHAAGKTKPSVVYEYGMYRCVE